MNQENAFQAASDALEGKKYILAVLNEEDGTARASHTIPDVRNFAAVLAGIIIEAASREPDDAMNIVKGIEAAVMANCERKEGRETC